MDALNFLSTPWPYLATAAFAALISLYVWRQPHRPGTRWFSWLMGVYLVWALAAALTTVTRPIEVVYGLFSTQSVCALLTTAVQLMVVLEYTGMETWANRRTLLLLLLPPLAFVLIALAFPNTTASVEYYSGTAVLIGKPAIKWGFYAYVATVFLIIGGVLFARLMRAPAFRAPLILIMVGCITPVGGFTVIRPEWAAASPIQASIVVTNLTMLCYAIALYSFRILQVIPVARDMVISHMPYGLLILDSDNRLVDFNAAARVMAGLSGKHILRQPASRALANWWDQLAPLIGSESISQDAALQTEAGQRTFHVTSLPLLQASGWRSGQVFLLEDVTEVRRAQQQQEQAQRSLAMLQERRQLARELHDDLGQVFAFVNTQGQAVRRLLGQGEISTAAAYVDRLVDVAREADMDIRDSVVGLRMAISGHSLFPSLAQYLARYEKNYGIHTRLEKPETFTDGMFEPLVEMQLLRILQEALTNVRKHARAGCVRIAFAMEDHMACVSVWDDGQGFDPAARVDGPEEHVGLRVMRERAEEVGGTLSLHSQPGQGTRLVVRVPVNVNREGAGYA